MIAYAWPDARLPLQDTDDRDPGLHLSQIIHDLCATLDPKRFGGDDAAEVAGLDLGQVPRVWIGSGIDTFMSQQLEAEGIVRPASVQRDGIWMNADGISILEGPRPGIPGDSDDVIVEEYKSTWMSLNGPPVTENPKMIHWLWQLKGYCWAYETCRARLRVVAVNGNYRPPSPQYQVIDLLFGYQELQDNWRMLVQHATTRGWL